MAIEQQCAAEAVEQERELLLDRFVIGAVRLGDAIFELVAADRTPPEIAVLLRPPGDDAEASARAR
jgi:hypothetical protein